MTMVTCINRLFSKVGSLKAVKSVRTFICLVLMMILASCANEEGCILADDWGQLLRTTVVVPANAPYTPANIDVKAGEKIFMHTTGAIDICAGVTRYDHTYSTHSAENLWQRVNDANVPFISGEPVFIEVEGSYVSLKGLDADANIIHGGNNDGRGLYAMWVPRTDNFWQYKYLSGTNIAVPKDNPTTPNGVNDKHYLRSDMLTSDLNWWPVANPSNNSAHFFKESGKEKFEYKNDKDYFFAMYDNKTKGDNKGGFTGLVPKLAPKNYGGGLACMGSSKTGDSCKNTHLYPNSHKKAGQPLEWDLYVRYARNSGSEYANPTLFQSPWRGIYYWEESRCIACAGLTIAGTCAGVAALAAIPCAIFGGPAGYAACYAGAFLACNISWELGCAGTGHGDFQLSYYHPDNRRCPEPHSGIWKRHWDYQGDADHWIFETPTWDMSNATVKDKSDRAYPEYDSDGGYNLLISKGCPGTNGQYMRAYFPNDSENPANDQVGMKDIFYCEWADGTQCDCPINAEDKNQGCRLQKDENDQPIIVQVPFIDFSKGTVNNISMDPRINDNITVDGRYGTDAFFTKEDEDDLEFVPYTGTLWFGIDDTVIKQGQDKCLKKDGKNNSSHSGCLLNPLPGTGVPVCTAAQIDWINDYASGSSGVQNCVLQCPDIDGNGKFYYDSNGDGEVNADDSVSEADAGEPLCHRSRLIGHPWGVNYNDNLGEYDVRIVTTKIDNSFSRFISSVTRPVKEILFGYCIPDKALNRTTCMSSYPPIAYPPAPAPGDIGKVTVDQQNAEYAVKYYTSTGGWQRGLGERLYLILVGGTEGGSNPFIDAVRASLVLYIAVYGLLFMFGMVKDLQVDFAVRAFKLAIIAQLLAPASFDFFSRYLFNLFVNGMDEMMAILANQFMGAATATLIDPITGDPVLDENGNAIPVGIDDPFVFVNQTVGFFFKHEVMAKVFALLFASPVGFIYVIIIFVGMFIYIFAILKAVMLYLLCMIAMAVLLAVAPIFLAFMLFERTSTMFDQWIKQLINMAAQPVFVLTGLAIFNVFVFSALYSLLYFTVCYQCVLPFDINTQLFGSIRIFCFGYYAPETSDFGFDMPINFYLILIFLIICSSMDMLIDWMSKLASRISSGMDQVSMADQAKKAALSVVMAAASVAKQVGNGALKGAKAASGKDKKDGDGDGKGDGKGGDKGGDKDGGKGNTIAR